MSTQTAGPSNAPISELPRAAIRFAGDSGDGMQLAGTQFTNTSAVFGNDVSTLPDFPAEIRAPAGTLAGVSGFQINFSNHDIYSPGDQVDALIAMNPAALRTNMGDLIEGGILIVNEDDFTPQNLKLARFAANPLEDNALANFRVYQVPITRHTREAVRECGLSSKEADRCKNFYALGLVFWLFDRPLETTLAWIDRQFARKPQLRDANTRALRAGFNFGDTAELFPVRYKVSRAALPAGKYRNLTGNQALAMGLITAARLANKPLFYGSYPITPASDILHELARHKNFDVRTFQAEDEIAAIGAVLGAAYAGAIAVTGSSGPGIALKQEGIGLAVMTELPCIIVDVQRGGPSTGLPTKTEQADLWQTMLGRNGECPVAVLAAQTPGDCFWSAIEAVRIATRWMTPVFLLSDGYLANGSEPWRIPQASELAPIEIRHATDAATFKPYARDERGARPWAIPGTPDLQHRIGGLEKQDVTGNINYEPENHQRMVDLRAAKIADIATQIPPAEVWGAESGALLLVSWGGTFGAVRTAAERMHAEGKRVGHLHLRWLNPLPSNVGEVLRRFERVMVCELNLGQLRLVLQGRYCVPCEALNKVAGRPLLVSEIIAAARLG